MAIEARDVNEPGITSVELAEADQGLFLLWLPWICP
jgi:hypothetical protein